MRPPLNFPPSSDFADLIRLALREDLGTGELRGDVTSDLTVPESLQGVGTLYQKSPGVVCGLPIVEHVCRAFDERLRVETVGRSIEQLEGAYGDGKLTPLLKIVGPMRSILAAERTVLNFVQRTSGIATLTHRYVRRVEGTRAQVLDTRKTLPGYRALDKYAVRAGGGANHRTGLYDMVLVKDNHLAQLDPGAWGETLEALVKRSKSARPTLPIEIEVVTPAQFDRVLEMSGVDIILLDNMDCPTMRECVQKRAERAKQRGQGTKAGPLLEASGGVSLETISDIARTGVDRISVGALTHSVPALDISLEITLA